MLHASQLWDLGALTVDVGFYLVGAAHGAVDKRVKPHADAVRAQHIRLLHHRKPIGRIRTQGGYTRGAQPRVGPVGQIAARGLLKRAKQIIEGGVSKRVVVKVRTHTCEELLVAHVCLQLL